MTSRADWTYVCGLTAVAETRLLTAGALDDLARLGGVDRLRQDLRQHEAWRAAVESDLPLREALEVAFVGAVRGLAADCPAPQAADAFALTYDYQRLRQLAKTEPAGGSEAEEADEADEGRGLAAWSADDLGRGWERTYDSLPEIAAVVSELETGLAGVQDGREAVIDATLDRAELTAFRTRVAALESDLIDEWAREYVLLRAGLAVVRGRAGAETVPAAMREHLLTGDLADEWLLDLADRPADEVLPALAERAHASNGDAAPDRLAVSIDDRLTELMQPAKYVAFGPERVFGYVWGLYVENLNLRLIAQAADVGLPADQLSARLRRAYG